MLKMYSKNVTTIKADLLFTFVNVDTHGMLSSYNYVRRSMSVCINTCVHQSLSIQHT